jgi:glycosyltransferase involved in cell wall biosynthesis
MPAYNAGQFIEDAIKSILQQTFNDFEFIIIDDGSTDNSSEIISSFHDPRIRYIKNEKNSGLIKSLNNGISLAKGKYIARMDADDIALKERFEKQIAFLENNPDHGLVGTNARSIDHQGEFLQNIVYPETDELIRKKMLVLSPFGHYSVMIKRSVLTDNNILYKEEFKHAEDYELWIDLSPYTKFHNLNEFLMLYRTHPESVSIKHRETQQKNRNKTRENYINQVLSEENIFENFYDHSYKTRVKQILLYKERYLNKYLLYKDYLLELMYLDALELVNTQGLKIAWNFSRLSIEKRIIYILKHYIKIKLKI